MSTPLQVLIVEDQKADAELMIHELRRAGLDPHWQRVETKEDYLAALHPAPDVILSDMQLPDFDCSRAFALLRERHLDIPFIIVSGTIGEDAAVKALKQGVCDYLLKDRLGRLGQAVIHALAERELRIERRKLEEQYRQAQKMEAIGQLAGGMAHDFNNLLTVITGYSEIVMGQLPHDNPHRGLIAEIHKAGDRAASLTRQLLAFSRKQVLSPEVLNLNALVTETERMLRRLIGEDIQLVSVQAPDLHSVKADPGQIEQILLNLAVNARDAMPCGGKLTIETANVTLDESYAGVRGDVLPGPYVILSISDTGCGMDKATQARIFEPYFTTKGPGKGTGLGLATVYGIVKQSGGFIDVASEPGLGAAFKVYLPMVNKSASSQKLSSVSLNRHCRGETVLLVEDDCNVRAVAKRSLLSCGYTILEASSGEEALQVLQQTPGPVHLMVSDVIMPTISGPVLAERVVKLRPQTKVLFVSGYTDDAVVRNGVPSAAVNFLQKPFSPRDLIRKVQEVLA